MLNRSIGRKKIFDLDTDVVQAFILATAVEVLAGPEVEEVTGKTLPDDLWRTAVQVTCDRTSDEELKDLDVWEEIEQIIERLTDYHPLVERLAKHVTEHYAKRQKEG